VGHGNVKVEMLTFECVAKQLSDGLHEKGGWLHNVQCKNCAEGGGGEVADLNRLLPKKGTKGCGVLLYLCNYWT
jgi:hypothetical protein